MCCNNQRKVKCFKSFYSEESFDGLFLGWGTDTIAEGVQTVGIVEKVDGKVVLVHTENMIFVKEVEEDNQ